MMDDRFTPDNFLRVEIEFAARNMIEASGAMRAFLTVRPTMVESAFEEIAKASEKASRAVENYKRAVAAGRKLMSREEFEGADIKQGA
jgi:hypothetical protein